LSWILSILVGLITAVAGCLGGGFLASLGAGWHRMSNREGGVGFFILFMGLLGAIAGFVLGVVCSRIVAGRPFPTFAGALVLSIGVAAGILVLVAGLAWFTAEFPPKIDGRELIVETEVRLPAGFELPFGKERVGGWYVSITADGGKRRQTSEGLDQKGARQVGGRWIVTARVPLETTDPGKSLGVSLGDKPTQYFRLDLPGHPTIADMAWSPWNSEATLGDLSKISEKKAVAVRTRVQFYVPPAPEPQGPSFEELNAKAVAEEEAAFRTLTPASSIRDWLAFTHYSKPETRREAAAAAIAARPDVVAELSEEIRSQDRERADLAMRAVLLMKEPPPGLAAAVIDVGRQIVADIREVNTTRVEDDPSYEKAADASVRFSGWMGAARALHGRSGVDMLPVLKDILEVAKVRTDSIVMRGDVVRVSGFYVKEWSGEGAAGVPGR
jgi:hypothetical protein